MEAFLSHSSEDKKFVLQVYDAFGPDRLWLDRAEIEWGEQFLNKIEEGIERATDFVLFWSAHSAASEWVKLEVSMAFMQMLKRRAVRFRIIRLDETELPLRLQPFHYLSVVGSDDPTGDVVSALRAALRQPRQGVRHRFLNRNSELGRIEDMVNDGETKAIALNGFQGIGKVSLAREALRRFFEGASIVEVAARPGAGPVEVALSLHHKAYGTILPEVSGLEALAALEAAMKAIVDNGQFIIFRDCHHWLDGDRELEEPLPTIIRQAASLSATGRNPIFLTSTRTPRIPSDLVQHFSNVRVGELSDDHMASLVGLWFELNKGTSLESAQAAKLAPHLHGHPVAAKLAANLVAQSGVDHLLTYPNELLGLRRDLAKKLIIDLNLSENTCDLMEILAVIGVPLPSKVLVAALGTDNESFQNAVAEATGAGIVETTDTGRLTVHPLVSDYFWRSHLDHADYRQKAGPAAVAVQDYFDQLPTESSEYVALVPTVFRLYVLSDNLDQAYQIRRDLTGELAQAAITHYNRRQYPLAESCIRLVLETEPQNWRMRQYLARIRIRQRQWDEADDLLRTLSVERPRDLGIMHTRGWRFLREERYEDAMAIFQRVLAQREHPASLRDMADCLYHLGQTKEALEFLSRAKQIESDNPYVLDLESRIHEELGEYEQALSSIDLAIIRDPESSSLHHRRGRILSALGRGPEAVREASEAVRLDPQQFPARSHFVSLLLDIGQHQEAVPHVEALQELAMNESQRQIATHLSARRMYTAGQLDKALGLVERQIRRQVNLAPSYGLLAQIQLAEYTLMNDQASASAQIILMRAKTAVANCEAQPDHDSGIVGELKNRIASLETLSA